MNTPTPAGTPRPNPIYNARALLKTLQESFPVFGNCAPLAIGIDKQLLERRPDIDRKILRIALGMHTNSLRYLKTMEKSTRRLERFKKDAERRQALRVAEAAAAAERERALKLNQLVEKFGRSK